MGADKELCDARGLNCIEMVEKEMKKLKFRISKEGFVASSETSNNAGVSNSVGVVDKTQDASHADDLQSIVSLFKKKKTIDCCVFIQRNLCLKAVTISEKFYLRLTGMVALQRLLLDFSLHQYASTTTYKSAL